jgi:SAM-dependent methyltransferase
MKTYLDTHLPVLEIGPLINPFLTTATHNVYYADINDKEGIFDLYKSDVSLGATPEEVYSKIVKIDFVVTESYAKAVGDMRFAAVFSSHVIEHVPDILRFLLELAEILQDDGRIAMAIPDKRYTFDHFREVTPFRDAYDVFINGETSAARLAFDFAVNAHPCNDPRRYVGNEVSFMSVDLDQQRIDTAIGDYRGVLDGTQVINAHVWVFTYLSFLAFLRDGLRCKMLPFRLEYAAPGVIGSNEFHIVLQKDVELLKCGDAWRQEICELTARIESSDGTIDHVTRFVNEHQKIYIYGGGNTGKSVFWHLQTQGKTIEGFIVSDGLVKDKPICGLSVYYLSDIAQHKEIIGIIVAMISSNARSVVPRIQQEAFAYICV